MERDEKRNRERKRRQTLMGSLFRMSHPMLIPREPIIRALDLMETDPSIRAAIGFLKQRLFKQGLVIEERTEMFKGLKKEAFHQFINRRYIPYCKQLMQSRFAAGFSASTFRWHRKFGGYPVALDLRRVQPCAQYNAVGEIVMTYYPISMSALAASASVGSWSDYNSAFDDQWTVGDNDRDSTRHSKQRKQNKRRRKRRRNANGKEEEPEEEEEEQEDSWFRSPPTIFTDFYDGPRSDSGMPVSIVLSLEDDAMFDTVIRQLTLKSMHDRSSQLIVYKKGNDPNADVLKAAAVVANAISPGCPDSTARSMLQLGRGGGGAGMRMAGGGGAVTLTNRTEQQMRRANAAKIDAWCRSQGIDSDKFMSFFYGGVGNSDSGVRFLPLGENQHLEKTPNPPDPPDYLNYQSAREERVGALFGIPRMLWTHASLNRKHKTAQSGGDDSADKIFTSTLLDHATSYAKSCSKVYHRIYKRQHRIIREAEATRVIRERRRTGKEKKRLQRVKQGQKKKKKNEKDQAENTTTTATAAAAKPPSEIVALDNDDDDDDDDDEEEEAEDVGRSSTPSPPPPEEAEEAEEEEQTEASNHKTRERLSDVDEEGEEEGAAFEERQSSSSSHKRARCNNDNDDHDEFVPPTKRLKVTQAATSVMSKSKKRRERLKRHRQQQNDESTVKETLTDLLGISPLFGLGLGLSANPRSKQIQRQLADSDEDEEDDDDGAESDGDDDRKDEETFNESIRATFSFPSVVDFMAVQKLYDDGLMKYEDYTEYVYREFNIPVGHLVEEPPLLNNEQKRELALQSQMTKLEVSKNMKLQESTFEQQQQLQEQQHEHQQEQQKLKSALAPPPSSSSSSSSSPSSSLQKKKKKQPISSDNGSGNGKQKLNSSKPQLARRNKS